MSDRQDLTRWNRAGLSHFTYVDGNAAEFLEILRQQLAEKFPDANWLAPSVAVPTNEKEAEAESLLAEQKRLHLREQRILGQYHQDRRDWVWEITRTFARSCHILTGYADAWANEGHLGTATQWDNVRRLVELLGYYPAPPASATTRLVLVAKKAGTVGLGFQVKNSPPQGAEKVIFETLEDLFIDPALNELRPKGWDKSEDFALPDDPNVVPPKPPPVARQFSAIANEPVIHLQGVGPIWSTRLDTLTAPESFKIKDFLGVDPVSLSSSLKINLTRLRELKAMATAISNFELEPGWVEITGWKLPRIDLASPDELVEKTGKTKEEAIALQLRLALIGAYLDQDVYAKATLAHLLAPPSIVSAESITSKWRAPESPKVLPGQIAMIFHKADQMAEAATVVQVDQCSGMIELLPSPVQYTWNKWPCAEAMLQVAPRWHRKCWLNGSMVIRTKEAHGLTAGAFIAWKRAEVWIYAEIIEADKRNLRLKTKADLPEPDTELFLLSQINKGDKLAADFEVIVILGVAGVDESITFRVDDVPLELDAPDAPPFKMNEPLKEFTVGALPAKLGSLPGLGSFLFPSPMLPMDLVKAAVELLLSLGVMVIPSTGKIVIKGLPLSGDLLNLAGAAAALFDLLDGLKMADATGAMTEPMVDWGGKSEQDSKDALAKMLGGAEGTILFKEITVNNSKGLGAPLVIRKNATRQAVVAESIPRYVVNGSPDKIQAGDWVVGRFGDGLRALELKTVSKFSEGQFSVAFEELFGNEAELQELYADFRGVIVAEGATVNKAPVDKIELAKVPESLAPGRKVLLTGDGKEPVAATVTRIEGNTITTDPPANGYTKGGLIICGNVVTASHGEAKPAKILGGGDATKSNQEFTLEVKGVSFTPDATMSAGVAAALEVNVAGRIWQQVATLTDSAPDDHHYATRMTEEGFVKIVFGDGRNGRRLPSGKNNVRVRYRVGTGLGGNVAAHSLEKPVNPHPLVASVLQPTQAAGGGEMEDLTSLQENAPSTVLTLERAVSLADFADLATSRSNIWQAKARSEINHPGQLELVVVTVVPADGFSTSEILEDVRTFLQAHALPGVQVRVKSFTAITDFDLKVTIRVKSREFLPDAVAKSVTAALAGRFSLKRSKLGGALYLSEVYKVVEGVRGVENSVCKLTRNGADLQVIRAGDASTVVYLNPAKLTVAYEEYRP